MVTEQSLGVDGLWLSSGPSTTFHKSKAFWAPGLLQPLPAVFWIISVWWLRVWEEVEALAIPARLWEWQQACSVDAKVCLDWPDTQFWASVEQQQRVPDFSGPRAGVTNSTAPSGLHSPTSVFSILPPASQAQTCLGAMLPVWTF